uniref:SCP domain-containing protein n=2 Tax=Parascaris univalens TaxID=6257 RepID=A0A915C5K4_PARUN
VTQGLCYLNASFPHVERLFQLQQAWGATTKIGCGIRNCTEGGWKTTFVVCNYLVAGNYFGDRIFEFGNGCSRDSDCTTYKGSRCNVNNKLCLTNGQAAGNPSTPARENNNQPRNTRPTSKSPTPSGNGRCRDRLLNCPQLIPFCSHVMVRTHCPATCRKC